MSNNTPITLTPEQLEQTIAAAVSAALSQVVSANGTAPVAPPAEAPTSDKWLNVVGYECAKEFTAYTSSVAVRNHFSGTCKCKKDGKTCSWEAKGRFPSGSFGSLPGLQIVKDDKAQRFTLADENGKPVQVTL
jgi:hypothetical protein